jgi:predicted transcriptional regulator
MQVNFPQELQERIDRAAAEQGRDSESLVREAVERSLDYDQWFLREVENGLVAAERGEFVDHEEVKKLVESRYR